MAQKLTGLILAISMCVGAASSARALPYVVGFDDEIVHGGVLSYNGTLGTSLTGSNIQFDRINGTNTPLHNNNYLNCVNCSLDLSTGGSTSESPYTFSGGGSFLLTGGTSGGLSVSPGTTLLSGSFIDSVIVQPVPLGGSSAYLLTGTVRPATLNADLAGYYGVAASGTVLNVAISFGLNPDSDGRFSATVTNVDVDYTPVPIPAALPLFLTALAGAGLIARRRQAA
jgi:hypothetical protein